MNILLAATATIQFVGLCMLVNNGPGNAVDVILPRVEQAAMGHVAGHTATESHTAIIAFERTPAVQTVGWTSQPLKPAPRYDYVKLNGEQLQVVINGPNGGVTRVGQWPSVTNGCPNAQLKPEYTQSYGRAAGVLRVNAGTLSACRPRINGKEGLRIDTRWAFEHAGSTLEIKATTTGSGSTHTKTLVLDPSKVAIIANVPTKWLDSSAVTATDDSALAVEGAHYHAFYTMLQNASGCTPQVVAAGVCAGPDIGFRMGGVKKTVPLRVEQKTRKGTSRPASAARESVTASLETYSCSNSQYP